VQTPLTLASLDTDVRPNAFFEQRFVDEVSGLWYANPGTTSDKPWFNPVLPFEEKKTESRAQIQEVSLLSYFRRLAKIFRIGAIAVGSSLATTCRTWGCFPRETGTTCTHHVDPAGETKVTTAVHASQGQNFFNYHDSVGEIKNKPKSESFGGGDWRKRQSTIKIRKTGTSD
jgi:hypothetical protein